MHDAASCGESTFQSIDEPIRGHRGILRALRSANDHRVASSPGQQSGIPIRTKEFRPYLGNDPADRPGNCCREGS